MCRPAWWGTIKAYTMNGASKAFLKTAAGAVPLMVGGRCRE